MSACIKQVLASYDDGMTPEDIADDQDLDVVAVKAVLMQSSPTYRAACKVEAKIDPEKAELNFDEEQLRRANQVIYDVMLSAQLPDHTPDYRTQLKAAQYIRDDVKGRLTPVKNINNGPTFNLLQFNEQLDKARLGAGAARRLLDSKESSNIVDVEVQPA